MSRLSSQASSGAFLLGGAQVIKIAAAFLTLIVAARILTPADFGLLAMIAPVTGFLLIFQNLGLNQAIVQAENIDENQVNVLFWLNMAAAFGLAILFVALAGPVSAFYGEARLRPLVMLGGVGVFIGALSLQHVALLNREMRFGAISLVESLRSLGTAAGTIALAALLHSYWALLIGPWIGGILGCILVWHQERWRPRFALKRTNTRHLVVFGANIAGFNVVNFLARNLDDVLIGRVWGAVSLGLYERSYRLMMLPLQAINAPLGQIMLPALSRLRVDPSRYRGAFVDAIRTLSFVSMPGAMAVAICSREVVIVALGPQWENAAPILAWLSLAALAAPIGNATGWLFMSGGRANAMMCWGLFSAPITISGFLVGLRYGAEGVAVSYLVTEWIKMPILFYWATRGTPVRAGDLYGALIPALIGGVVAWPLTLLIRGHVQEFVLIIACASITYSVGFAAQKCSRDGRRALTNQVSLLWDAYRRLRRI